MARVQDPTCPIKFVLLSTPQPQHPEPKAPDPESKDSKSKPSGLQDEWRSAIHEHFTMKGLSSPFVLVEGRFGESGLVMDNLECDCVVSPANSFGIMDGGFDLALSRHLHMPASPGSVEADGDFWGLTNHVQRYLEEEWNGYIPPGNCMIVPLPQSHPSQRTDNTSRSHIYGIHALAILPTMRVPQDVSWHKDLVYNAVWALMSAVERWNRKAHNIIDTTRDTVDLETCTSPPFGALGEGETSNSYMRRSLSRSPIRSILMTGLGTGTGNITPGRCAQQVVLAVKHFYYWGISERPRWNHDALKERNEEVEGTIWK
ncbi:hypothetical protein CVT24_000460 [Panaeolus cyanescens]|uniref:Macro-like domain-containing protein n=1 Tax=Panaeolus cyanescens TaxID=181874 RepID=A0A409V8B7_9AGAR|nr:hypothetical protein CVT24_000460 [Panaeolus cyanescens]